MDKVFTVCSKIWTNTQNNTVKYQNINLIFHKINEATFSPNQNRKCNSFFQIVSHVLRLFFFFLLLKWYLLPQWLNFIMFAQFWSWDLCNFFLFPWRCIWILCVKTTDSIGCVDSYTLCWALKVYFLQTLHWY